jgi:hypothetical protein
VEVVYFTLVAIALYVVADRALDGIERALGRRLEYRTLIFFAILLVLALVVVTVMRRLLGG